jgi:hypothetical protein
MAIMVAGALLLAGCAAKPPPAGLKPTIVVIQPVRWHFDGRLNLAGTDIVLSVSDTNGIDCSARYAGVQLPETASLDLTCRNGRAGGTLKLTKADDVINGEVVLADGVKGDVVFKTPPSRPPVLTPVHLTQNHHHVRHGRGGCGSRGSAGHRLKSGKCASRKR